MTPMEAWHIISANLANYHKLQKTATYKGYTDADTEAEAICFMALKEMEERERKK